MGFFFWFFFGEGGGGGTRVRDRCKLRHKNSIAN